MKIKLSLRIEDGTFDVGVLCQWIRHFNMKQHESKHYLYDISVSIALKTHVYVKPVNTHKHTHTVQPLTEQTQNLFPPRFT